MKAERKCQADQVRQMRRAGYEAVNRKTEDPRRQGEQDRVTGALLRRKLAGDDGAWVASLHAVAEEYRRAETEQRSAARREAVRLRREDRQGALAAADSELDRRRRLSASSELTYRSVVASALQREASARQHAAQSVRDARAFAARFQSARRESAAVAGNVARRISACCRAHLRFVEQDQRECRLELAASAIQRQKDERRQRSAEVERIVDAKRQAVTAQAVADRSVKARPPHVQNRPTAEC